MNLVKCECNMYILADEIRQSDVSNHLICDYCETTCPNCGSYVSKLDLLHNGKCTGCDTDY